MGEAKRRQFRQPCAYCGSTEKPLTDDHVPPTALLLKGFSGRLSVRSCDECNAGFGRDLDDRFAVFMAVAVGSRSTSRKRLWEERAQPILRAQKKRLSEFLASIEPVMIRGAGGLPSFGGHAVSFDADLYRRMIGRITRGLYYRAYRRVLPDTVPIDVEMLGNLDFVDDTFLAHAKLFTIDEQFGARGARAEDSPDHSLWIYHFHGGMFTMATTGYRAASERNNEPPERYKGALVLRPDQVIS